MPSKLPPQTVVLAATAPVDAAAHAHLSLAPAMLRAYPCNDGLTGLRDRALLLIGYAGALRRAELVASSASTSASFPTGCV
jgi:hypothetical protein